MEHSKRGKQGESGAVGGGESVMIARIAQNSSRIAGQAE